MKMQYRDVNFRGNSRVMIDQANQIIEDYYQQGYVLTLRQLYYQFVSRDLIPNNMRSYKRLGSIINDARLCGLIDWESIEDRTRELSSISTWNDPSEIVEACAQQFKVNLWEDQPYYIEVWVEKEALAGVVESACNKYRIPFLSCRGYTSQSEMWRAGQRLLRKYRQDKEILILHLGDHDPSGIDMSRDITERLTMFMRGESFDFKRLALNIDQVREYQPPPNPAKMTDSRFREYVRNYGQESWELDALEPKVITRLIHENVSKHLDKKAWKDSLEQEEEHKRTLENIAEEM